MIAPLLGVLGAVLVTLALLDMLWTTVAVSAGAGPLTSRLSHLLWRLLCRLSRRSREPHRVLRVTGVLVVVSMFTLWLTVLTVGWGLVFSASETAVVTTASGEPASFSERLYFAGYSTATLGNGEYRPGGGVWQLLTVMATFSGLGMATMGITYLVPVTQAVVDRRTLALEIDSLGRSPTDIVVNAWEDGAFPRLGRRVTSISSSLSRLGQRHLAYPILHYFHDVSQQAAGTVKLAVLDEALTLLRFGVRADQRPDGLDLASARESVGSFLSALSAGHIGPADAPPPLPDLAPLRTAGLPTVSDETFAAACGELEHRRRLLRAAVEDDGWTWDQVCGRDADADGDEPRDAMAPDDVDAGTASTGGRRD